MYNRHFGLSHAPFRMLPDTRRFFGGGRRAEILDTLVYAITSGEGIVKVSGEVGTGKTMLCRMLQERLPDSVEVVYLANPSLDSRDIVAAIAIELKLPVTADTPPLQLQQTLQHYLLETHEQGRQVVVFIEEAQRMPLPTLEEIRLLSNLETSRAKLLQLVLFGQPELNLHLDNHDIRQLKDRISHSFDLGPLTAAEVRDYVRFRLHSAGYTGNELFSPAAYRQLAWSSQGLIRRLHVLADKAMLSAFADGSTRVCWRHVRRAAADDRQGSVRKWHFMPRGLAPGLLAGLVLAAGASQLHRHFSVPEAATVATVSAPTGQNIDDLRRRAAHIQPAAGLPLVSERLQASQRWLAKTDRHGLTIQLLLSQDDDVVKLEKLLSNQPYKALLADIYLHRSEVGGRQRWSLLYGDFDTKSKALAALAALPDRVRLHQPYLRPVAALRGSDPATGLNTYKEEQG
jgi:type II secretory pathway predicted ATPase ExeA